ncbi:diguanylate cyclase (GGDEF)-like protein [Amaricoccus macauensis]|uniref:Diguanylate cyclase (GGDEF)-like protein n=1 Tax=Amaricoccus macauensis TaxID=57001 RepID=A0A840SVQ1_9RHOB|nr:sensor domain-containing diguanylate cyclase [Amaricoccus macauensis]MBB5223343.1 diguanylate cyclase (GGDEF)-like protein [Amaricoccus macauensis]
MDRTEQDRLNALLKYAIAGTPPEPNFDRVTLVGAKVFGSAFCTLNLVEAERLWIKSRHGIDVEVLPRSMSFCDHTIRGSDVMVVPDATLDPRFADSAIVAGAPNIRFYAGAPLETPDGHRIGTLCLLDPTRPRDFTAEEAVVLRNLAATAMELIEARSQNIRLSDLTRQISHQANHDALTGLANRRELLARCDGIRAEAARGEYLALLYIDLDGFKAVNDTRGHLTGDELLVQVAARLREGLRDSDCLARIGGDEFVVVLRGDERIIERAEMIAARLIQRLGEPFLIRGHVVGIGASVGVAVDSARSAGLEDMLKRADTMLYKVKSSGKNNFMFWTENGAGTGSRAQ